MARPEPTGEEAFPDQPGPQSPESSLLGSIYRFQEYWDWIPDPVLLHDRMGRLHYLNRAAQQLLKISSREILKKDLRDFGFQEYLDAVARSLLDAHGPSGPPLFEAVLRRGDEPMAVEIRARLVQQHEQTWILSVLRDVTERKFEEKCRDLFEALRNAEMCCANVNEYLTEAVNRIRDFSSCACVRIRTVSADGAVSHGAEVGFPSPAASGPNDRPTIESMVVMLDRPDRPTEAPNFRTGRGSFYCGHLSAYRGGDRGQTLPMAGANFLASPFESVALVPVMRKDETMGLIQLADNRPGMVSQRGIEALEEAADQITLALRQFRMDETAARENQQLEIGYELASGVLAGTSLDPLLRRVLRHITGTTEYEAASIERCTPSGDRIATLVYQSEIHPPVEFDPTAAHESGLARLLAESGAPLLQFDPATQRQLLPPLFHVAGVLSFLAFPIRRYGRVTDILALGSRRKVLARSPVVRFCGNLADQLALAIMSAEIRRELEQSRCELQALSSRLICGQEEERARMARELHDRVGQILVSLQIETQRAAPEGEAALRDSLGRFNQRLADAQSTVRNLTRSLRPGILDDLGLVAALDAYIEEFGERTGVDCVLSYHCDCSALPSETALTLYRVAQEALTNAARHARAPHVEMCLTPSEDLNQVTLRISDDGCGFDPAALDWSSCFGLLGMRERLQLIGGRLVIDSQRGAGATIQATVPTRGATAL
jgi:PAS domain S-box-containing protein